MSVKMKDIAEYLGLSKSTVSLALNNTPGSTISTETRNKVVQAAKELGYKGRVFIPQIAFVIYHRQMNDPRYLTMLAEVEKSLREYHYNLLYKSINSHADLEEFAQFLERGEVAGVLVTGEIDDAIVDLNKKVNIPCLFIGDIDREDLYVVTSDYRKGAYDATKYLLSLGHRKIAFLSGRLDLLVHRRGLDGYLEALEEAGVELDKSLIQVSNDEDGYELCGRMDMLNIDYSAAFCVNTIIQFGVLQRLKEKGVRVPEEISLIGYGQSYLAQTSIPPLTTLNWDDAYYEIATNRLMDMIRNPDLPMEQLLLQHTTLNEGSTCAPYKLTSQRANDR